jgi:hypothetical protein
MPFQHRIKRVVHWSTVEFTSIHNEWGQAFYRARRSIMATKRLRRRVPEPHLGNDDCQSAIVLTALALATLAALLTALAGLIGLVLLTAMARLIGLVLLIALLATLATLVLLVHAFV